MKFNYLKAIGLVLFSVLVFSACKKNNNQPAPQLRARIEYNTLTSSSNYIEIFKDKEGNSIVDFSGQTTRQDMLSEIDSLMRIPVGAYVSASVPASSIPADILKKMFSNTGNPFRTAALNAATDKQLKNKTAASFTVANAEIERAGFEVFMDSLAIASQSYSQVASPGVAGIATSGSSKYLVSGRGIEYSQVIIKGLFTAGFFDQIVNGYLGDEKQGVDNTQIVAGKKYTQLEHHWDEAYGYITKNGVYPQGTNASGERHLGRYAGRNNPAAGNSADLFLAYLKGRAAIVNNDKTTKGTQIAYIRTYLEKIVASNAINYLNVTKTKTAAADQAAAMHAFAEGLGFIYGLRYAYNAKINATKSNELLAKLLGPTGFYGLTPAKIDEVRDFIATTYGISNTFTL